MEYSVDCFPTIDDDNSTDEDRQRVREYFALLDAANDWANYLEQQALAEEDECEYDDWWDDAA